jgi:outer membrane lipoprotein-sorting protein
MRHFWFIFLVLCVSGMSFPGRPAAASEAHRDKAKIFTEIAASASRVKTLSSDFTQEKHLSMLDKVLTSQGRFFYKRDNRLRWELNDPVVSGFAVNGTYAARWDAQTEIPQSVNVNRVPFLKIFSDQVFSWAKADFKRLQKQYHIQVIGENPVDLKLDPKSAREKKYLDHLRIVFATDASHVRTVEVHEPDGDFTAIRFINTQINAPLPDSLFGPKQPDSQGQASDEHLRR